MFGSPKLCATAARGERIAPFPWVPLAIGGIPLSNRVILAPIWALVAGQREARLRGLADAYGALAWRAAI
jgi:hypothetical protein